MLTYHLVIDARFENWEKQMQEQVGFAERFLDAEGVRSQRGETYIFQGEGYTSESALEQLEAILKPEDLYVFGSHEISSGMAVRAAVRGKGSSVTDIHGIEVCYAGMTTSVVVKKMVYANHMEAVFAMEQGPYCVSLVKGMGKKQIDEKELANAKILQCGPSAHVIGQRFIPKKVQGGLQEAKVIVVAGRGVGKKENMEILEKVAEKLDGEIGVSRPAAMNAWESMEKLLGVSGAMVSPEICIVAGVSGAAAFYAGIEKAKYIVAINKDEHAPIMKMADVAVADDFVPVMETLNQLLENDSGR